MAFIHKYLRMYLFPLKKHNVLYNKCSFSQIRKLMLVQCYCLIYNLNQISLIVSIVSFMAKEKNPLQDLIYDHALYFVFTSL